MNQFHLNDIVRIVRRSETYIVWNDAGEMDNTIGSSGVLINIGTNGGKVRLNSEGDIIWGYDWGCMELETDPDIISELTIWGV